MPTAYSYIRFSSKKQEQNDSVKRQTRLRDEWLRQHPEMTLDTTISLQDLGVSAFRGRNLDPDWGDLGKFIDLAERQDSPIEKGSVLLLERLDRFSRQRVSVAYTALMRLVQAGIKVVVLDPTAHQIDKENVDQLHVVLPIVTNLCLAHEQSREKSRRVAHAWNSRREDAREGKKIFTKRLPSWLRYDEKTKTIKMNEKSCVPIKYIFERTSQGIGQVQLVKELNEKFAPISSKKQSNTQHAWNTSYLSKLLNDRSVIGEFQPHTLKDGKKRVPDGSPIKDYFPRIVSDELFYQAQYQKSLRKKENNSERSNFINLFTGLVINNHDRHVMQIQTSRTKRKNGSTYLQRRLESYGNRRGMKGSCPWGIDYYSFETVILHALSELNPDEFNEKINVSAERRSLYETIEGIELRIKDLEKSILDLSKSNSVGRLSRLIDELYVMKSDASNRLGALVGIDDSSAKEIKEGIRSIAVLCNDDSSSATQNIRAKIKGIIPLIVERIEVALLKRTNNTVIARAIIFLKNGRKRIVSIRKTKGWKTLKHIVYFDAQKVPRVLVCPYGSVIWSEFHGLKDGAEDGLSDAAKTAIIDARSDLQWVSVDGVVRRIGELYARLIDDYFQDEMEDFSSATLDWGVAGRKKGP